MRSNRQKQLNQINKGKENLTKSSLHQQNLLYNSHTFQSLQTVPSSTPSIHSFMLLFCFWTFHHSFFEYPFTFAFPSTHSFYFWSSTFTCFIHTSYSFNSHSFLTQPLVLQYHFVVSHSHFIRISFDTLSTLFHISVGRNVFFCPSISNYFDKHSLFISDNRLYCYKHLHFLKCLNPVYILSKQSTNVQKFIYLHYLLAICNFQ